MLCLMNLLQCPSGVGSYDEKVVAVVDDAQGASGDGVAEGGTAHVDSSPNCPMGAAEEVDAEAGVVVDGDLAVGTMKEGQGAAQKQVVDADEVEDVDVVHE